MAARKLARELSGLVLVKVVVADGTGLVLDFVGMQELGCFKESFEIDGHGLRREEGWLDLNLRWGGGLFCWSRRYVLLVLCVDFVLISKG